MIEIDPEEAIERGAVAAFLYSVGVNAEWFAIPERQRNEWRGLAAVILSEFTTDMPDEGEMVN